LLRGKDERFRIDLLQKKEGVMNTAKSEVESLLEKLPDDCTLEDVQYHLYVVEKINRGIDRAEKDAEVSQEDVEKRLGRWAQ